MQYWIAGNKNGEPVLDAKGRPQIIGSTVKSSHCLCPAPAGLTNGDGQVVKLTRVYDHPGTGRPVEVAADAPAPRVKYTPAGTTTELATIPRLRWVASVDEEARKERDVRLAKQNADAAAHRQRNAYRQARRMQYATRLSGDARQPSLNDAFGDVLDILIKRVRQIEATGIELPENKEWTELLGKIDAIKAEHPKV